MMKNILTLILFFALYVSLIAQQSPKKNYSKLNINCKTCHTCDVPTKTDPCLVTCPRDKMTTVYESADKTPETIVLDQLVNSYGPVYFPHKAHAQMAEMGGGCESCHHHNTSGPILKCSSCHETSRKRGDIGIPDLKAAYHRLCIDCHREWSHNVSCNTCHVPKKDLKNVKDEKAQKKYYSKNYPIILEPSKIVFKTNYEKGNLVTFYHNEHNNKFGLTCTSCHKNESCATCHDLSKNSNTKEKTITVTKSNSDNHKKCSSCHQIENNCSMCHQDKVAEPFNHGKQTGWALNRFHINLSCAACHGEKLPYKKLDTKCISCHKNWNNETFKHSITGLQLNEIHSQLSCEDCHTNNNYSAKTTCNGCHDNYSFPKQVPGKIVGKLN